MKQIIFIIVMIFLVSGAYAKMPDFPQAGEPQQGEPAGTFQHVDIRELPGIHDPLEFFIEQGRLYVSERTGISIINLENNKLIKKFGKKGEGPGEWLQEPNFKYHPDYLVCDSQGKLIFFDKEGNLSKEILHHHRDRELHPLGKNFAGSRIEFDEKDQRRNKIAYNIYDLDIKPIKKIYEMPTSSKIHRAGTKLILNYPSPNSGIFRVYKDRVYISDTRKGFHIGVFDPDGKMLYEIKKDYEKVKVTEADKKKRKKDVEAAWAQRRVKPQYEIIFAEYFLPPYFFYVNSDRLYVYTEKKKNGSKQVLIMDLKGNDIKKGWVPDARIVYFQGDLFYCLKDNPDKEIIELHMIKL